MNERKIREENFKIASYFMAQLVECFAALTKKELSKLSAAELIKGIDICIKARAQAAGLPKFFQQPTNSQNLPDGEMPSEEREITHQRMAKLADDLRKEMARKALERKKSKSSKAVPKKDIN